MLPCLPVNNITTCYCYCQVLIINSDSLQYPTISHVENEHYWHRHSQKGITASFFKTLDWLSWSHVEWNKNSNYVWIAYMIGTWSTKSRHVLWHHTCKLLTVLLGWIFSPNSGLVNLFLCTLVTKVCSSRIKLLKIFLLPAFNRFTKLAKSEA